MKLIPQGLNQCQVATLAMLSDQPLDLITEYACNLAGVPDWKSVLNLHADRFWDIMSTVAWDAGLRNWRPPGTTSPSLLVAGDESYRMKRGKPPAAELVGRGQLTYRTHRNRWHAVAFEDGVIFDGALSCRYSIDAWMKRRRRKWLTYYTTHC